MCDDVQLCTRCVHELLILARTWFAFGLPSKTGCDSLVLLCDLYCKGERLQLVEIPRKREKNTKQKVMVFKLIIGSLERVECNPRPLRCHNVEVGKCYTWSNHGIKHRVSCAALLCDCLCSQELAS
jgi:hypothetical protein